MTGRANKDRKGIVKHPVLRRLRGNLKVAEAASVIDLPYERWSKYENYNLPFSMKILQDFEVKALIKYPFYEALK